MTLADPVAELSRLCAETFRVRRDEPPDVWADRERIVPEQSPRPGPWSTDFVAYLREPLRDLRDPEVRKIVMMCGTQIGKTEFVMTALCWIIDNAPGPTLFVMPNQDDAGDVNTDRLLPALRATPATARHLSARPWDTKIRKIAFDAMRLWFVGANSAAKLASRPIQYALGDEIDKWPRVMKGKGGTEASAVRLLELRTDAFSGREKVIFTSSPSDEGVGIDEQYAMSDRARFFVRCPLETSNGSGGACGHWQPLVFGTDGRGGVRWEGGVGRDLDNDQLLILAERARRTAWYECEKCGGKIEQHQKPAMVRGGQWVRPGQRIENGRIVGEGPPRAVRGYHLNQLYSPFRTWGDVAADFVKIRGIATRDFVNARLAEPWREPGERSDEAAMDKAVRLDRPEFLRYAMGTVPDGVERFDADPAMGIIDPVSNTPLVLTGAIDVQQSHVYFEVLAWGERETCWLVDWGAVECPEISPDAERAIAAGGHHPELRMDSWALVEHLVRRDWPVGVAGARAMRPLYWAIDSGDRTGEVYRFCQRIGPTMLAVKGEHGVGAVAPARMTRVEDPLRFGLAAPIDLLLVNTDYWKNELFSRLSRQAPAYGSCRWPLLNGGVPGDYLRMLTSEERVTEGGNRKDRKGVAVRRWRMKAGRRDNHALDCRIYNMALASCVHIPMLKIGATPGAAPAGSGVRIGGAVRVG